DLVIDVGVMNAGVQSPNESDGNGATYNLTAGTAMPGLLSLLTGGLDASAGRNGKGGTINIKMNSSDAFVIDAGGPPLNGSNGPLTAFGGSVSGDGGSITVQNLGTGGIQLTQTSSINVSATEGNGGHITLSSPNGQLLSAPGTLSVDAAGSGDFAG